MLIINLFLSAYYQQVWEIITREGDLAQKNLLNAPCANKTLLCVLDLTKTAGRDTNAAAAIRRSMKEKEQSFTE